jgi:hypothetical protein
MAANDSFPWDRSERSLSWVIWAALMLVIALVAPGLWAWYMSGRQLAATTEAQRSRVYRLAVIVSAGVGVVILAVGVVAFVLTSYDWVVLAATWSFGLLHLSLLTWSFRRVQKGTSRKGVVG